MGVAPGTLSPSNFETPLSWTCASFDWNDRLISSKQFFEIIRWNNGPRRGGRGGRRPRSQLSCEPRRRSADHLPQQLERGRLWATRAYETARRVSRSQPAAAISRTPWRQGKSNEGKARHGRWPSSLPSSIAGGGRDPAFLSINRMHAVITPQPASRRYLCPARFSSRQGGLGSAGGG